MKNGAQGKGSDVNTPPRYRQRGLFDVGQKSEAGEETRRAFASHTLPAEANPVLASSSRTQANERIEAASMVLCPVCDGPAQHHGRKNRFWCGHCEVEFEPVRRPEN
jgi:hypothetical protein